jgi:ABC-type glutathione transport system ATPase component
MNFLVDSHVGKHIFDEVIDSKTGILRNKTRVLVTNSLSVLPYTDQIIVLKEGKISEMGTYRELLARKQYFSELIEQYSSNNKPEVEDKDEKRIRAESKVNNDIQMDKTKLVEVEKAETGRVKFSVYFRYFKAISVFWCSLILLNYALMQVSNAGSSVWLAKWSNANDQGDSRTAYYLTYYGL